jgi:hypothetical protein
LPWAVAEDREGLLQARQVDGADQHRGLAAVASDRHPPGDTRVGYQPVAAHPAARPGRGSALARTAVIGAVREDR